MSAGTGGQRSSEPLKKIKTKVVLLGDVSVGKTSLALRYSTTLIKFPERRNASKRYFDIGGSVHYCNLAREGPRVAI